ncbi:MAG: HigA family addiction module antitoxin [Coriobacteriia bacterium]|nr:HigA family addiction module antitoxin [Coriobacteriia bacterium]
MADTWQVMTRKPTHPGEMLREEFMDELGISVAQLANMLGVSRQTVNELVHERRGLSPDMAIRLGKLFGMSPQSWMNLQRNIDLWESLSLNREAIDRIEPLAMAL